MPNSARDMIYGLQLGEVLGEGLNKGVRSYKNSAIDDAKVEEIRDDKGGLKYRYGDKTYASRPTDDLVETLKMQQRAKVEDRWGDSTRAEEMRKDAIKQRAAVLDAMSKDALQTGTPEAVMGWYNLAKDNGSTRVEDAGNGNIRFLWHDNDTPDQATPLYEGPRQGFQSWAMKNYNPELSNKIAESEALTQQRLALAENYGFAREDRRTANQDRMSEQQRAARARETAALERLRDNAATPEERAGYEARLRQYYSQEAGLGGGGGGELQNGAVPPKAVYDYALRNYGDKGLTPAHAVGILASIAGESNFNPGLTHDGGTGYGLFGHRDPPGSGSAGRRSKLFAHAGTNTPSWTQQLDYAMTEPEMQQYLSKDFGNDYGLAAREFTSIFEKPKNLERDAADRAGRAGAYAPFMTGGGGAPSGGQPQTGLSYTPEDLARSREVFKSRQEQARQAVPKPGTAMSQKDLEERRDQIALNVQSDPRFKNKSVDLQEQEIARQFADFKARLAGEDSASGAPTTYEERMAKALELFKQVFGEPTAPQK